MTDDLDHALSELRAARPVVIPTDTVYGLAADPQLPGAVAAVFRAKGRPEDKPLPVLAASAGDLDEVVVLDDATRRLASRLWPGPLTLVLRRAPRWGAELGGSAGSVAVRVPAHPLALELLTRSGPLAVTSANLSGQPPQTTVAGARKIFFGTVTAFVDGGVCDAPASSVISLVDGEPRLLRPGPVSLDAVRQALE